MKIKYQISDGTVLAIGAMPNLPAGPGQAVEDYAGVIPVGRVDFWKRTAPGVIAEKNQSEKNAILDKEKKFTVPSVKTFVNVGPLPNSDKTLQGKFDRLLDVVANMALYLKLKESEVTGQ